MRMPPLNAALRFERTLTGRGISTQGFDGADGSAHELPAAIRAFSMQTRRSARAAECAFERTDHCFARARGQIAIAALAVRLHEQHGGPPLVRYSINCS